MVRQLLIALCLADRPQDGVLGVHSSGHATAGIQGRHGLCMLQSCPVTCYSDVHVTIRGEHISGDLRHWQREPHPAHGEMYLRWVLSPVGIRGISTRRHCGVPSKLTADNFVDDYRKCIDIRQKSRRLLYPSLHEVRCTRHKKYIPSKSSTSKEAPRAHLGLWTTIAFGQVIYCSRTVNKFLHRP